VQSGITQPSTNAGETIAVGNSSPHGQVGLANGSGAELGGRPNGVGVVAMSERLAVAPLPAERHQPTPSTHLPTA
jgi:hypothetical protein